MVLERREGAAAPPVERAGSPAAFPADAERDRLVGDTIDRYRRYLNPGLARLFKFGGSETVEWAASGCLVWDVHGREYVDCACGPAIFNVGHRHPRVLAAVRDQLDRMPMSVRTMPSAPNVLPWNPSRIATIPGRPVASRASLSAPSTDSAPLLQKKL